jgi:hypothetical protein
MKDNFWAMALLITVALSLQVMFFQYQQIDSLKQDLALTQKAKEIEQDQSQDLMYRDLARRIRQRNRSPG